MNRTRLLALATFLDTLPEDRFFYGGWVSAYWNGDPDLFKSGVKACALAWATTIPEFKEAGLRLEKIQVDWSPYSVVPIITFPGVSKERLYLGGESFQAGMRALDLSLEEVKYLFVPGYPHPRTNKLSPSENSKPQKIAAHIRRFVEENNG